MESQWVNIASRQHVSHKRSYDNAFFEDHKRGVESLPTEKTMHGVVDHEPLLEGEIRLVDFGAKWDQSVLQNIRLDSNPDYIAISYCWGSENCLHPFRINQQTLILTSSLYAVFAELWDQGYRGKLWADAICINQQSIEEKVQQIPLMHQIYANAAEVLGWLGPGRHDHSMPMDVIDKLIEVYQSKKPALVQVAEFDETVERLGLPSCDSPIWAHMVEALSSPYFDRLWTLQEAVIPSKLFIGYGRTILAWETLNLLQRALRDLFFEPFWRRFTGQDQDFNELVWMDRINSCRQEYHSKGLNLMTIFEIARGKKVTRIHDRVYAIYGFMDVSMRRIVPIDLHASPQKLFTRAAKAMITFEPSLDLLANSETPSKLPGLPSWVPDLTSRASPWMLAGYCGFNAGLANELKPAPLVSLQDDENRLATAGFHLATVAATQLTLPTSDDSEDPGLEQPTEEAKAFLSCVDKCRRLIKQSRKPPVSDNECWSHLERVLVCDRPKWDREPCQKSTRTTTGHLRKVVEEMKRAVKGLDHDFGGADKYSTTLKAFNISRSFFITNRGHMGMGPGTLQAGDHILVLRGGETPFAARENSDHSSYQLLGECFVDGIMEGQAYRAYKDSGKEDKLIVID